MRNGSGRRDVAAPCALVSSRFPKPPDLGLHERPESACLARCSVRRVMRQQLAARPCQLKQPQREIRPGLTIGNHGDLCTGCNRSWCLKRKLDKARPADCGCPCQKTRGIERAPRDHSPTGDRREKRLFRHFCPRKMPTKPRFFGWFSAQNPARC